MFKYIATVNLRGQAVKTIIYADSQIHARLLLQYNYGINSLLNGPTKV
jgi:hypothetical protein